MNQILVVGNKNGKNNNSTVDIKKVVLFFSIAIIVFGVILMISGIAGLNKNKKNNNGMEEFPGMVEPPTPTPTDTIDDEDAPTIELSVAGENVNIVARDETEIDYIEYSWNGEDIQIARADANDKNKIETSIAIKQGTNTLKVTAVDKAGNTTDKEQDFQGKIRPVVSLFKNVEGDGVIITAKCEDGISRVEYTLNGKWTTIDFEGDHAVYTKEDWATVGVILEYSADGKIISAEYTQKLVEGENNFTVYAYSKEGLPGTKDGKATYP